MRLSQRIIGCLALAVLLVAIAVQDSLATFPGRNGVLAFSAYSLSEESSDISFDAEYVGIARLRRGTRHIIAAGLDPAFSPNGRRLAYARSNYSGIWLTRPDCRWSKRNSPVPRCSRLRRLTRGVRDSDPAWSPSGKRIAFVGGGIHTMRASGGGLRRLAGGRGAVHLDWSSTGALAFESSRGGIRVRDPGGRIRTVTRVGSQPTWAPTGDRLAFTAVGEPETNRGALYKVNADGTGLQRLWVGAHEEETLLSPEWSPDGRSIAFIKSISSLWSEGVYVIRPDGTGLRRLMPPLSNRKLNFNSLSWQARP